jgi:hypothetical protein
MCCGADDVSHMLGARGTRRKEVTPVLSLVTARHPSGLFSKQCFSISTLAELVNHTASSDLAKQQDPYNVPPLCPSMSIDQLDPSSTPIPTTTQRTTQEEIEQEATHLREFTRSPHPYHRHGSQISQQTRLGSGPEHNPSRSSVVPQQRRHSDSPDNTTTATSTSSETGVRASVAVSVTGSESGTEADDERPDFVKLLPPPTLRPRKGLKVGERSEEAFLSPSQLDDEGRDEEGYFHRRKGVTGESEEARKSREREEQEKLYRRRLGEFVRRSSEVALVGVIVLLVLCGEGV